MNLDGNFIIYEDWAHRRLAIHRVGCSQVAKHGGVSSTNPPGSWYCGPFGTLRQAQWKVNTDRSGWAQDTCSTCDAV